MLADFVLPISLDGLFTYRIPESMTRDFAIGKRALVPFGKKKVMTALSVALHEDPPAEGIETPHTPRSPHAELVSASLRSIEIKDIICLLDDEPILTDTHLRLWQWIADYYMATLGDVMRAALPAQLKLESETHVSLSQDFETTSPLRHRYAEIYDLLSDGKVHEVSEIARRLQMRTAMPQLNRMLEMGAVVLEEKVQDKYRPKYETYITLARPLDEVEDILNNLSRAPQQQAALLRYIELSGLMETALDASNRNNHNAKVLKSQLSPTAVKSLIEKNIFKEEKVQVMRRDTHSRDGMHTVSTHSETHLHSVPSSPHTLTPAQTVAKDSITAAFAKQQVALLHGVTGSGKTDIYIHLILDSLKRGENVLYLVPEIALTTQLTERLRQVFGEQLLVYHSRLSDSERFELFQYITNSHEPYILLGVRSAVLLPIPNLQLIIVDEEHDPSYRQQDPAPRYHARQVALVLASYLNAHILLGSATPSLESYYNAIQGKYCLVSLKERYGGLELPKIELIDLKQQYHRREMQGHLSDVLVERMRHVLEEEEKQVMVFQNRRGYSTFVQCRQCGYVPKCQNCDVSLTYHKRLRLLTCHYCGFSQAMPLSCPQCGCTPMTDKGIGTEKVEDEIQRIFPKARLARMDLDTTQRRQGYQKIIDDFSCQRTDILVGTQMITKGLDFSSVRLVAVLNADSLFMQPDFRQSERAFALLEQVSGRAGRHGKVGEVIIQTSNIDNDILHYVLHHDYEQFAQQQLRERELFHYPPFYKIIYMHLEHADEQHLIEVAGLCQQEVQRVFGSRCSKVTEPYVGRVKNRYRRQIMLKLEPTASQAKAKRLLRDLISQLTRQPAFKGTYIYCEVD